MITIKKNISWKLFFIQINKMGKKNQHPIYIYMMLIFPPFFYQEFLIYFILNQYNGARNKNKMGIGKEQYFKLKIS